jgi:hypothetical protein
LLKGGAMKGILKEFKEFAIKEYVGYGINNHQVHW